LGNRIRQRRSYLSDVDQRCFGEKLSEAEVSDALRTNQSTINRRKQEILNRLRKRLGGRNEFKDFLHKDSVCSNLTNWLAGLSDVAL
jgi:L-lactate utilization protein LutB